jgi:predicted nucleic acid-binding protein
VIAVDTNLLVFAHRDDSPFHEAAWRSLTLLAESRAPWAIPWPCIHEFFSIATHPRIYNPPTPIPKALDQIEAWMESPSLVLLNESPAHRVGLYTSRAGETPRLPRFRAKSSRFWVAANSCYRSALG